ncbi:MAG TPA: FUSC family protein [Candidatus Dormibacteraeota bacterium]|nr:FUSC family protein [Candidatus Dormibacteraeota bacterium]
MSKNAIADSRSATKAEKRAVAPAFWRILTFFDRQMMSPQKALRNALGVTIPLIAGFALGMPRGGLVVASGALNVAYSDGSDPYEARAKRMLSSSFWCAMAIFLGGIFQKHTVLAVVIATVWAFVAGLMVSLSPAAGDVGVISLVSLLIYAAQPLTPSQAAISGLLALAGGLLQTALSIALWPVQRFEPERRALSELYRELANIAEAPLRASVSPPASGHSTKAQEMLSGLSSERSLEALRYRSLLNQAERMRLSLMMLVRLRARLSREAPSDAGIPLLTEYLENAGKSLEILAKDLFSKEQHGADSSLLTRMQALTQAMRERSEQLPASFLKAVTQDLRYQMDAFSGQLRAAWDLAGGTSEMGTTSAATQEAEQPWSLRFNGRLATLRANLNLRSVAFRHAIRLAACVAVGDMVARSISLHRSYWLPMTIVLVLKPEFTATFTRGVLRIAGTVAGLLLATGLFHLHPTSPAVEIALIFVFTFLLRWIGPANYGIFAVAISALVVLLLSLNGVAPKDVILARGLNTIAGGTIALIAYALWPTWERGRVPEMMAQLLDAYREYFHAVTQALFHPSTENMAELERTRLESRRARSNLEASLERLRTEPGTTLQEMERWNAMLASSHRFAHATMALEAGQRLTAAAPGRNAYLTFSQNVEKTLSLLAKTLRGRRAPEKDLPNLREDYNNLLKSGDPQTARYALTNVEADRMTNSLNTLREQISDWEASATNRPAAKVGEAV